MFGIHVHDLDEALERIARVGGAPLTAPVGTIGARRVCVRDPDGVTLELMEDWTVSDPHSTAAGRCHGPSIEFVSVSVTRLEQVRAFWIDVLGLQELGGTQVHDRSHERLWGLRGVKREAIVLGAGGVALEFASYDPPCRARPAGYLISDIGVLNIALGTTERSQFDATYERAAAQGFKGYREPFCVPDVATVVYLRDPQGLSVELLHVEPRAFERMGFVANESSSRMA
jgi:predicted enzyme related to lactoylglutathione lyase